MFDRPKSGEKALLIDVAFSSLSRNDEIEEFISLAESAGADCAEIVSVTRASPDSRYFIGSGKADEIKTVIKAQDIELVIVNNALSPSQERNLEQAFECRVLDRAGLILDIFAQRARSFEGKLQVELAQLRHLSTRLIRGWTHLERQKGGIGLRGPGETQLETDRRLLNNRIAQIRRRLEKVNSQRDQGRRARQRAEIPTVSLVGYTNAGKSTLFNALTAADVYVQDQLFATLDPTLRKLQLDSQNAVILADTVGFVSDLPHELVAAFRATLQETISADLLIHVVDGASERNQFFIAEVNAVLKQIDADKIPQIIVYNKMDLLDKPKLGKDDDGKQSRVWLSAATGLGLEELIEAIREKCLPQQVLATIELPAEEGRLHALLHEYAEVENEEFCDKWVMDVRFNLSELRRLRKNVPDLLKYLPEPADEND